MCLRCACIDLNGYRVLVGSAAQLSGVQLFNFCIWFWFWCSFERLRLQKKRRKNNCGDFSQNINSILELFNAWEHCSLNSWMNLFIDIKTFLKFFNKNETNTHFPHYSSSMIVKNPLSNLPFMPHKSSTHRINTFQDIKYVQRTQPSLLTRIIFRMWGPSEWIFVRRTQCFHKHSLNSQLDLTMGHLSFYIGSPCRCNAFHGLIFGDA